MIVQDDISAILGEEIPFSKECNIHVCPSAKKLNQRLHRLMRHVELRERLFGIICGIVIGVLLSSLVICIVGVFI